MRKIRGCVVHYTDGFGPSGVPGIYVGPVPNGYFPSISFCGGGDIEIEDCIVHGSGGHGVEIVDTGCNHSISGLISMDNGGHGLSVRAYEAYKCQVAEKQPNRQQRRQAKAKTRQRD